MSEAGDPAARNPEIAYERSDWHVGGIGLVLAGIFAFLVVAPLILIWAFPVTTTDVGRQLRAEPPAPRLQTNPSEDLAKFQADEDRRLNTYYWIDKQKGVIHIPIADAMRKLAQQGIDGFPKESP